MINGYEYSWEDINIAAFGRVFENIVGIDYGHRKDHTNLYGRGDKPVAMGRGRKTFPENQISLLQSDVEALQAKLPKGKDLTDIAPFTITVSYAPEGGAVVTDQLLHCRFTEVKKGMKEGDPNQIIPLSFIPGDIKYNI